MWKWKLLALITPTCWITVGGPFNRNFDKWLNDCIDKKLPFENVRECSAKIGGVELWIENHPYASFTPYGERRELVRPSRATRLRAHHHLMKELHWP